MANATLSTYPTTVDTFNRISDLDKDSTMIKARQYKSYINAGNYTGAENYLKNNPDLKQCAISAEIVNKHSDAIVAIENDINNNVKSDISDVKIKQNDIDSKVDSTSSKLGYKVSDGNENQILLAINENTLNLKSDGRINIKSSNSDTINFKYNIPTFPNITYNTQAVKSGGLNKKIENSNGSTESLYEICFYGSGNNFIDASGQYIYQIPNTGWYNKSGSAIDNYGYEIIPFSIEGGVKTKTSWYPIGYNDGVININATFNQIDVEQTTLFLTIKVKGLSSIDDIKWTKGIIKYTRATY